MIPKVILSKMDYEWMSSEPEGRKNPKEKYK